VCFFTCSPGGPVLTFFVGVRTRVVDDLERVRGDHFAVERSLFPMVRARSTLARPANVVRDDVVLEALVDVHSAVRVRLYHRNPLYRGA
jgi:hypothetical protein